VESISADGDQIWQATLVDCEDSSFSFTIFANSIYDLAGNTGPALDVSLAVVVPVPAPSQAPTTLSTPEAVTAPVKTLVVPRQQSLSPGEVLESAPIEDAEIAQSPTQRTQAAQSVITASSSAEPANSNLGWTVGLAIAGVLLLAAGLSLRRRGISDLLVG
jgi:hypothetical protein